MQSTTRTGLRRFGGAALAVVTAAALAGLSGPAYADETAPAAPAPIAAESTAPAASPAPTENTAPTASPAPSDTPAPAPSDPAPASNTMSDAPRAAAGDPDLAVSLRGTTVSTGAEIKVLQVSATNHGSTIAENVVLDVTITPAGGPNRIELMADAEELDCAVTGTDSYRCEPGDLPAGAEGTIAFPYRAADGAAANPAAATVTATVSASSPDTDATNDTVNDTIAIVPPASDVVVIADDIADAVPGEVVEAGVLVVNFGARATGPVELAVQMPTGTTIVGGAGGCTTAADRRSLTCRYDRFSGGRGGLGGEQSGDFVDLLVKVDESVVGPRTLTGGLAVVRDDVDLRLLKSGPVRTASLRNPVGAARIASLVGDADETDNSDIFAATVLPVANLVVTTKPVRVSGRTATVPYTVGSTGPSVATGVFAKVTAPTGTTFAAVPAGCERSGRALVCDLADSLAPGGSVAGTVKLKVTGTSVGRNGSIVAGFDGVDPARANNTVAMRITVPAGAGTLDQGRLAVTGTRLGMFAGTGAALLLLGGALVLIGRRRRAAAVSAGTD